MASFEAVPMTVRLNDNPIEFADAFYEMTLLNGGGRVYDIWVTTSLKSAYGTKIGDKMSFYSEDTPVQDCEVVGIMPIGDGVIKFILQPIRKSEG